MRLHTSYAGSIYREQLDHFRRHWPCHGLPDNLDNLTFAYETNGDLLEIVARDESGCLLDSSTFDGPALLALSEDAQRQCHPEHADIRFGKR